MPRLEVYFNDGKPGMHDDDAAFDRVREIDFQKALLAFLRQQFGENYQLLNLAFSFSDGPRCNPLCHHGCGGSPQDEDT